VTEVRVQWAGRKNLDAVARSAGRISTNGFLV
jgi:hypothetical protein